MLSCLLYLIYILDKPGSFDIKPHTPLQDSKCQRPTVNTYVDDFYTAINTPKNDPDNMTKLLQDNLYQTKTYMDANKLSLNEEKTKIFLITKHPDCKHQVKLTVGDKVMKHNKSINILGI